MANAAFLPSAKLNKWSLDLRQHHLGKHFPGRFFIAATEQIASLGGWDASQGVMEVDEDNVERTLAPGEIIEIKPGRGFGKKHRWKRG